MKINRTESFLYQGHKQSEIREHPQVNKMCYDLHGDDGRRLKQVLMLERAYRDWKEERLNRAERGAFYYSLISLIWVFLFVPFFSKMGQTVSIFIIVLELIWILGFSAWGICQFIKIIKIGRIIKEIQRMVESNGVGYSERDVELWKQTIQEQKDK